MQVWMARDPHSGRITMQPREFGSGDFPPGPEGRSWPIRTGEVADEDWAKVLRAELSGDEVDRLHEERWNAGGASR